MDTKLFASDFDGTLFHRTPITRYEDVSQEELITLGYRDEDLQAIESFRKAGHVFGLCTGRAYESVHDFLPEDLQLDFIIASSGGAIYAGTGEILDITPMEKAAAAKLLEKAPIQGTTITSDAGFYIAPGMEFLTRHPRYLESFDLEKEQVIGISLVLEDEKAASQLKAKLEEIEGIAIHQNQRCLDCTSAACSKASGLHHALELFQVDLANSAAAGDSYNDLPMLEAAAQPFTFHDAPPALQKKAAHVVDGIREALELFQCSC